MIDIRTGPGATVTLKPSGDLDSIGAVSLRHVVEDALRPRIRLVIDLEHVHHLDALGISALIGSLRRVRAVGGDLHVVNPRPAVRRALHLTGVSGRLTGPWRTPGDDAA